MTEAVIRERGIHRGYRGGTGKQPATAEAFGQARHLQQRFGNSAPAWPELAATLTPWLHEIAEHGRFNLLLTDGRAMLAHASTRLHWLRRQAPFGHVRLRDGDLGVDLALLNGPRDRMTLVATEPLTHDEFQRVSQCCLWMPLDDKSPDYVQGLIVGRLAEAEPALARKVDGFGGRHVAALQRDLIRRRAKLA